jgi:hypothetical protein
MAVIAVRFALVVFKGDWPLFVFGFLGVASSQVQDFENIMENLLFFSGSAAKLRTFVISIIYLEVYLERAFW